MKIRWNSTSVRLRITPDELESLQRGEGVSETLEFGNGYWEASLSAGDSSTSFWIERMIVQIHLSASDLDRLAAPENEGVYFVTGGPPEAPHPIRYFIEKDFPCAHPRAGESQEPAGETFAPTAAFEERKKRHD